MNKLAMVCQRLYGLPKCLLLVILAFMANFKGNTQCNADFSYSIDFTTGYIRFTNHSTFTDSTNVVTYTWYSNPATVLSNDTNPVIHFNPGIYPMCLVLNNGACVDTLCMSITFPNCHAAYGYNIDFATDSVSFVNNSFGTNLHYFWSFGDAKYSTDQSPTHRFASNGWYNVCLHTANADSTCVDDTCKFVRVNHSSPSPCVGSFSFETDTVDSYKVTFANTTLGDTAITYFWLFGDTATSTAKAPMHRFDTIGNYKVCLLVSGPNCADSICKTVEIINIIPFCKADFSYALFSDSGNNATRIAVFNNKSGGSNLTYKWTFADSTSSTETSPMHYFGVNGRYKVCLTVQSGVGCTDSMCVFINIQTGLLEQKALDNVKVYPVPAKSLLTIDLDKSILQTVSLTLYDFLGNKKAVQQRRDDRHIELEIADLPNGLYLLELKTDTAVKTIRIMK